MEESMEDERFKITRGNGITYSVRQNRDRFFYPNEWKQFYNKLSENQRITFATLINTGARINEVRHIKVEDIDFDRNTIVLKVTKVKAAKGEKNSRPRTISVSSQFIKGLWTLKKEKGLKAEDYIPILSTPAANICMKKTLMELGIKDWYMFAVHNVRKTHGNWLKAMGIDGAEICIRLGHDYDTFIRSYGSPDIFSGQDLQDMRSILGDLYYAQSQWGKRNR